MSGDLLTPGDALALVRDARLAAVSLETPPRYEIVSTRAPRTVPRAAAEEAVVSL